MAPLADMPGSETKSVLSAILLADSFAQVCSLRGSGDWLKPVYALHCICQQTSLTCSASRCHGTQPSARNQILVCVQSFAPVTLEKPKMLLPLVNVPMMDYTLEWLAASGVEEVGQHHKLTLTAFEVSTLLMELVLNLPGVAGVCCVLCAL